VKAFNTAQLTFPWRHRAGPRKGELDWKPLQHHVVLRVLHNPRYAGAFTFGRRRDQVLPGGKTVTTLLPRGEWIAFIPGAHPGYITVEQYEANLAKMAANAAAHGPDRAAGPAREGPALLQGIIICGRCGNRMTIRYHTRRGQQTPTYLCQRDGIANGHPPCAVIPGHTLDQQIGEFLISQLTPLAAEAALTVSAELEHRAAEADALRAAHIERARYHADLARRRYLAVDPANRLVAGTLEADWNTALRALGDAQATYDKACQQHPGQLTEEQKARIRRLATDLPGIWNDPATPMRERKRITRLLLTDVTVTRTSDTITAHARLAGGQHHTLTLPAPRPAWAQRQTRPRSSPRSTNCSAPIPAPRSPSSSTSAGWPAAKASHSTDSSSTTSSAPTSCAPAATGSATPACSPSPRWQPRSACQNPPSRPGTTPELSADSAITIKAKSSTTRPAPTRQPRTTDTPA
jgi:hypothetical protein